MSPNDEKCAVQILQNTPILSINFGQMLNDERRNVLHFLKSMKYDEYWWKKHRSSFSLLTWSQDECCMCGYSLKVYCLKPMALTPCSVRRAHRNWTIGSSSPVINYILENWTVSFWDVFILPWHWRIGRLTFLSPETNA